MQLTEMSTYREDTITLELDRDAFQFLSNCVNETRRLVDEWEFQTLLGNTVDEARSFHDALIALYRQKWPPGSLPSGSDSGPL